MKSWGFMLVAFALGCDAILENETTLDTFTCSVIPYYAGDCTDPAVRARVSSVLANGAVEAQITCTGVALGAAGKFASVHYEASRLQDGSCFATATVTGPAPAGGGFAQSSGTGLSRRTDPAAASCPVASFHPPQLLTTTRVEGGVVRVESPFCGATPCQMLVASNCSGDVGAF